MENSARRLASGELEETIMSATGPSATPDVTSDFHTTLEECNLSSLDEVALRDRRGAGSSMKPKSEYFSARVEEMMQSKSHFSSVVEHEIEHSRVHWSELSGLSDFSEDMSTTSPSTTPDVTSNLHTALEECNLSSLNEVALDNCSGAGSSMEPKSEYFSARVEEMMRSKSQFSSTVEHEIEHSRVHWSEVSGLSNSSEDNNNYEEVDLENVEVFTKLMNNPQWRDTELDHFFMKCPPFWKLGRKIAEGGQAEIFEVMHIDDNHVYRDILLKVFKRRSRLSDLRKQWPCGVLRREVQCIALYGLILEDGRFAFGMTKSWGDLRKFIDQAMQEKNNQGPPFPNEYTGVTLNVKDIMSGVAYHMDKLHERGILHRDLKVANVLLHVRNGALVIVVADFECSIGVVRTRFWRAPEVLLALKNRSVIDFSEKVDVYSYAMMCFEIVTGRLPFEGELEACRASNDLIIEGRRPKLPSDLDVTLKDLIERCWNPILNERPSFSEILEVLES